MNRCLALLHVDILLILATPSYIEAFTAESSYGLGIISWTAKRGVTQVHAAARMKMTL